MARTAGKNSKIYVDEFDISGLSNAFEMAVDNNLPDVTAFADAAKVEVEGKYSFLVTINAFGDLVDDAWDEQAFAILGENVTHYLGLYPGNLAAQGNVGYELQARPMRQPRRSAIPDAYTVNAEMNGDQPAVRATVLANGAVTATGVVSGSNKNVGASASGKRYTATLRVLSVSGAGSITALVEQSTDDGAVDPYATLFTFTAATGKTVERVSTTSATEAWKRVRVSAFSGFTSVTILVTVGVEQGT